MSDYPLSYKYSISDVDEANRLYDRMPLREVSKRTGIPSSTLRGWSQQGYISTEANHLHAPRSWDWETVHRANELYDTMTIKEVSAVLGVPTSTLYGWSQNGWISTEENRSGQASPGGRKGSPERAAELVYGEDLTQTEAAERMDLSPPTITRYLKMYRQSTYKHAELD